MLLPWCMLNGISILFILFTITDAALGKRPQKEYEDGSNSAYLEQWPFWFDKKSQLDQLNIQKRTPKFVKKKDHVRKEKQALLRAFVLGDFTQVNDTSGNADFQRPQRDKVGRKRLGVRMKVSGERQKRLKKQKTIPNKSEFKKRRKLTSKSLTRATTWRNSNKHLSRANDEKDSKNVDAHTQHSEPLTLYFGQNDLDTMNGKATNEHGQDEWNYGGYDEDIQRKNKNYAVPKGSTVYTGDSDVNDYDSTYLNNNVEGETTGQIKSDVNYREPDDASNAGQLGVRSEPNIDGGTHGMKNNMGGNIIRYYADNGEGGVIWNDVNKGLEDEGNVSVNDKLDNTVNYYRKDEGDDDVKDVGEEDIAGNEVEGQVKEILQSAMKNEGKGEDNTHKRSLQSHNTVPEIDIKSKATLRSGVETVKPFMTTRDKRKKGDSGDNISNINLNRTYNAINNSQKRKSGFIRNHVRNKSLDNTDDDQEEMPSRKGDIGSTPSSREKKSKDIFSKNQKRKQNPVKNKVLKTSEKGHGITFNTKRKIKGPVKREKKISSVGNVLVPENATSKEQASPMGKNEDTASADTKRNGTRNRIIIEEDIPDSGLELYVLKVTPKNNLNRAIEQENNRVSYANVDSEDFNRSEIFKFEKRVDEKLNFLTKILNTSLNSFVNLFTRYLHAGKNALDMKLKDFEMWLRNYQDSHNHTMNAEHNTKTILFTNKASDAKSRTTNSLYSRELEGTTKNKTNQHNPSRASPRNKEHQFSNLSHTLKRINVSEIDGTGRSVISHTSETRSPSTFAKEYIKVFLTQLLARDGIPAQDVKKSVTPVGRNLNDTYQKTLEDKELKKNKTSQNETIPTFGEENKFQLNKENNSETERNLSSNTTTPMGSTNNIESHYQASEDNSSDIGDLNATEEDIGSKPHTIFPVSNKKSFTKGKTENMNTPPARNETLPEEQYPPSDQQESPDQYSLQVGDEAQGPPANASAAYKGIFGKGGDDLKRSCINSAKGDFADYCPKGWANYKQFCFMITPGRNRWSDVSGLCGGYGGKMAMPKSQDVLAFLVDALSTKKQYTSPYLVGLRKIDEEWKWIDDTPLSHGLSVGKDGDFESCAVIQEGSLRKRSCNMKSGYICEVKLGVQAVRVLAFGDSLTNGYYNGGHNYYPYGKKLEELLNWDNHRCFTVETSGKTGEKSDEMVERMTDYLNKKRNTFDWVIILAGTNDLMSTSASADTIAEQILIMHEVAHARGAHTIVVTIPEIFCERTTCKHVKERRRSANKKLRGYAEAGGSKVFLSDIAFSLSLHRLSLGERKAFWEPLGVHMKPAGYDRMAHVIFKDLMEAIESPP